MKFQDGVRMKHCDALTVLDNDHLEVWYQETPGNELLIYDGVRAVLWDAVWKSFWIFPIDPVKPKTLALSGWVKIGEL